MDNKKDQNYTDQRTKVNMITADKIISVEDERQYFERKNRNKENTKNSNERFLTVADILTAEDEENNNRDSHKKVEKEKNEDQSQKIDEVKKLNIEKAPFEDEVKVAKAKLEAERLEKERLEAERLEKERLEKERLEAERLEKERLEKERLEAEKIEKERQEFEKVEKECLAAENLKKEEEKKKTNQEKKLKGIKKDSQETMENNVNGAKKGKFRKFLLIVLFILIIIYGVGCFVFKDRYFVGTKINGIDAALKTPEDINKMVSERINGYKLSLSGRHNVKDEISGSAIDIKFIPDDSAKKIKEEQGVATWPLAFINGEDYNGMLNVQYDNAKLADIIKNLNIFKKENITKPVSAYPVYDIAKKEFIINHGAKGSTPITANVNKFIGESIKSEVKESEYPDSVYEKQKNNAQDPRIQAAIKNLDKYVKMNVEYNFVYEKYNLPGYEIIKFFDIDTDGDYSVKLNRDKVREFVRSLSRKYSTYGDARTIKSASTGGDLKVSGGIYGWLIDREKETDALKYIIAQGKSVSNRTPIYQQTAISRDKNDLGDEFIEIDLTKQHMWFVRKGEVIVSTAIVSGNPNAGDATPTGIYPLNYKTRNATLRGPGYASPVSYWMPFNGDIGIHDASWQPVYGGSRYLYAGSHGCINTPFSKVKEIYSLAKEGMPIIVHK